ncbi:hypothetical protein DY000_02039541 [Brassica cretica]|uniref:Uncharacterized protein n=1 Tax=Brassica cretica TaxID=69181 RepID=A0ABQ7BNJ3_BRACR|nr:hypothetical protein DY000_02039541 [Brassica cretica]
MEGSPCRKSSISWKRGPSLGPIPGFLLAGTWSFALIARFRHRTRGITCALKSTGVAHSQQASVRQDIAPVILLSQVWGVVRDFVEGSCSKDTRVDSSFGGLAISSRWPQSNSSADFWLRKMNPELLAFPSSLVGGRPRPHRLFTDPFSSPIPSWGDVPEADNEAVPMAPLRFRRSCFFDDGPRSEIREGDLAYMRRKYAIHPSVGMRST